VSVFTDEESVEITKLSSMCWALKHHDEVDGDGGRAREFDTYLILAQHGWRQVFLCCPHEAEKTLRIIALDDGNNSDVSDFITPN